jgi:hypothetical protein
MASERCLLRSIKKLRMNLEMPSVCRRVRVKVGEAYSPRGVTFTAPELNETVLFMMLLSTLQTYISFKLILTRSPSIHLER